MAKFTPRKKAPSKTNKNYINYKFGGYNTCIVINDKTGYVMPNCVGYAQGRLLEILGKKAVDWKLPACNAEDWIDKAKENGLETGKTPKLGAVICWRAGKTHNSSDGAGHVAVVEEIKANGDIVVSNSAYNGDEFYLKTITKASGYVYSNERPFVGFVYCGIEFETKSETEKSSELKSGMKISLNKTPCYKTASAAYNYDTKSGLFWLWSNEVVNGRIRITNKPERVGVAGQVTCWIKVADFTEVKDDDVIRIGDKVKVTKAINYDTGKSFKLWHDTYDVLKLKDDRAVIGVNGVVTSAIDIKYLKKI